MTLDSGWLARWGGALLVVLALHGAAVFWLLERAPARLPPAPAAPEALMLDLSPALPPIEPAAVAPPLPVAAPPPPPEAVEPPPPPPAPLPVEVPPATVPAEAVLPPPEAKQLPEPPPPPPKPRPVARKAPPRPTPPPREIVRQEPAPEAAAPPVQQAAPAPAAARPAAPPSNALPNWRSALIGRLQAAKRYPEVARSRGDQGTAIVSFTMDRAGRVLAVSLVRSSGATLLDEEAVALVHRAAPLPALPDEIPGATLTLTVPISFTIR